jgi:hypothetical protein
MCKRCEQYFTIHSAAELDKYLEQYDDNPGKREDVLQLWYDRRYFGNLIYLEYLYAKTL